MTQSKVCEDANHDPNGRQQWSWLLFAVPLLYAGTIWFFQPDDHLGYSVRWPAQGRLLYDDYDVTAFAVRGLNAELERSPGRRDDPCEKRQSIAESPAGEHAKSFYLEYPPAALVLFRLPYWWPPRIDLGNVPLEIADACHNDIVEYAPRTPAETTLWRKFRQAARVYNAIGIGCLLALMVVIRMGYVQGFPVRGAVILLVLPAALYFSANRFDALPALLTALSLALLGRDRLIASAVCLGLATMIKVYPGLAAILVVRFLSDRPRAALTWAAVFVVTMVATITPVVSAWGWEATLSPYKVQLSRGLESWTFYGHLLPWFLGADDVGARAFRLGTVLIVLLVVCWHRPILLDDLLRRAASVLIVFVSVQVFYSPQWVLWLAPFLVPLAGKDRVIFWLTLSLDLITYLTFPAGWDFQVPNQHILLSALTFARAIVLGWLVVRLVSTDSSRHPIRQPSVT